jgi:hypothetical protein
MSYGSGLLSTERPKIPHLAMANTEVGDLRRDLERTLAPIRARTIEEFTAPAADAVNSILTIAAGIISALTPQTILPAQFNGALGAHLAYPRQFSATTGGVTPAHSPASLTVKGKDARGIVVTEVVALGQIAGTDFSSNFFVEILEVMLPAGTGVAATFTFGHGEPLGLTHIPKARAGGLDLLWEKESTLGVVTTGTITSATADPPYGAYTPATPTDGAEGYAIEFEYDPTV